MCSRRPISASSCPSSSTPCPPKPATLTVVSRVRVRRLSALSAAEISSSAVMPTTSAGDLCGGSFADTVSSFLSRKTPSGNCLARVSPTHLRATTGSILRIVGQGERISTSEKPSPIFCVSSALRTARRVLMMFLLSLIATRSM